jgi:two-component system cell cycle response regulator
MNHERREPRPGAATRALKVLVVEGDRAARASLQHEVMAVGHRCAAAADGLEAWEIHEAHRADVILCDWSTPRLSGAELCARTRARAGEPYTYFVALAGLSGNPHFAEGMAAGADDYMRTPVDAGELAARLASAGRVLGLHQRFAAKDLALRRDSQRNFEAARLDPLTGVANRRQLTEDLAVILGTPYRLHHSVALCDIDGFKLYNDRFEHQAGDEALRDVASAVRQALRHEDTVYRYGGEEFLVILRDHRLEAAVRAMERVRLAVEGLGIAHPDGPAGVVTISVGVAELAPEVASTEEWVHRADSALYRAKAAGKNRVEASRP